MRKISTLFATIIAAVGLMVPACAAETTSSDAGEYTESQQYVYLVQGANMYLSPDETSDVYLTAETAYNEEILISNVTDDGWAIYKYWYEEDGISKYLWLYIAPDDVIWAEEDAYTEADYQETNAQMYKENVQPCVVAMGVIAGIEMILITAFAFTYTIFASERLGDKISDKIAQICTILQIAASVAWIFIYLAAAYICADAGLHLYGNATTSALFVMYGFLLAIGTPVIMVKWYSRRTV